MDLTDEQWKVLEPLNGIDLSMFEVPCPSCHVHATTCRSILSKLAICAARFAPHGESVPGSGIE